MSAGAGTSMFPHFSDAIKGSYSRKGTTVYPHGHAVRPRQIRKLADISQLTDVIRRAIKLDTNWCREGGASPRLPRNFKRRKPSHCATGFASGKTAQACGCVSRQTGRKALLTCLDGRVHESLSVPLVPSEPDIPHNAALPIACALGWRFKRLSLQENLYHLPPA